MTADSRSSMTEQPYTIAQITRRIQKTYTWHLFAGGHSWPIPSIGLKTISKIPDVLSLAFDSTLTVLWVIAYDDRTYTFFYLKTFHDFYQRQHQS